MIKVCSLVATVLLSSIIGPINTPLVRPIIDDSSRFSFISDIIIPNPVPQGVNYFNCQAYGPFTIGGPDISATFDYRLNITDQDIIERIRLLNSNSSVVHASSKPSRSYANNALLSVTFTIPIHDYLTNDGLTIKFEILNKSTREIIATHSATFYPVTEPSVSYVYLKQNVYETRNIGFYGDQTTMRGVTEKYDFRSIDDYLDIDYYYRMDLKNLFFRYESAFPLQCNSINLRFEDRDNLFPFVNHDSAKNIVLPLKLVKNGTKVNLKFNKTFYINKRTLQISDTYHNGFVTTQEFYLPINGKKRFNNKTLYLDIDGLGKSQLSTSFPIHYFVDKSLVGASNDGIHHIGGGSR